MKHPRNAVSEERIERLRRNLLSWGESHIENYPWRYRTDAYSILVAEFMLHRTQASQVIPVYRRFIVAWPKLETFVQADRHEIEEMLSPLGLEWRINAMIEALERLWNKYGQVPPDLDALTSIYGVGPYIAGATVCFTLNRPVPLVDTNTVRVTGRVFGLNTDHGARRRRSMIDLIERACDPESPRDFYCAMIDLAHTICTPDGPSHSECPLLHTPCCYGVSQTSRTD